MIISAGYGYIEHGYYSTSHASQGDTVDYVLLAQSDKSLGKASSAEQFTVSVIPVPKFPLCRTVISRNALARLPNDEVQPPGALLKDAEISALGQR